MMTPLHEDNHRGSPGQQRDLFHCPSCQEACPPEWWAAQQQDRGHLCPFPRVCNWGRLGYPGMNGCHDNMITSLVSWRLFPARRWRRDPLFFAIGRSKTLLRLRGGGGGLCLVLSILLHCPPHEIGPLERDVPGLRRAAKGALGRARALGSCQPFSSLTIWNQRKTQKYNSMGFS